MVRIFVTILFAVAHLPASSAASLVCPPEAAVEACGCDCGGCGCGCGASEAPAVPAQPEQVPPPIEPDRPPAPAESPAVPVVAAPDAGGWARAPAPAAVPTAAGVRARLCVWVT